MALRKASLSMPWPETAESSSTIGLRTTNSVKGPVWIWRRTLRYEAGVGEVTRTKWVEVGERR